VWHARREYGSKIDFKSNSCGGGTGSNSSGTGSGPESRQTPTSSASANTPSTCSEQQFNIFPAIFSRQLNFHHHHQGHNSASSKLMDELRPNLGLLGLMDDHHHLHHHHHHHEKRIPKSEAPDFAALYGLSNPVIDNQQPSALPSRHLAADHSSKLSLSSSAFALVFLFLPASLAYV